jgi:hypothetical protein
MSGRTDISRGAATLWIAAALLAAASVLIVNGRPLFYFDTIGYVDQGKVALTQLGLVEAPAATGGGGGAEVAVRTVDGSRSPFYSFLAGIFSTLGFLEGLLVFNAAALALMIWLLARIACRTAAPEAPRVVMACLPVIAASLGSLPFFAAYLMPDLMAPVMILSMAALTAFGRDMSWGELLLGYAIGAVAVVSHLSHFGIAVLMVPAALLVSPLIARRRWWLAPLLVAAILGAAWAQQKTFRVVAAKAAHSEVVIKPFITARLIEDGPGLDYLDRHCPDPAIATCALHEALQRSDDPYRLTASHIIFETSAELGSFRLMSEADQKAVADGQTRFFLDVLKDRPVAVALAILENALQQSSMVGIDMTLPFDNVIMRNATVTGAASGPLAHGRITAERGWISGFTAAQKVYYFLALALVLAALFAPARVPWPVKGFAVMVLLGILANALVCGGISQPASRYGSRMIWLVPFLAAFMSVWLVRPSSEGAR